MVYEARGRYAEAADAFRHVVRNNPSASKAFVARMDAKLGRTAEARRVARELEEASASGEVAPTHVAVIYSALHDTDRALAWLEKGLATWDVALRDNIGMVTLSELRGDPRFEDLRRRMLSVEP
jgi:tetratricopeptide (TPR) repeat protein